MASASTTGDRDLTTVTFHPDTIAAICKSMWKDSSTKASKDAIKLTSEFLRLFVLEAIQRATTLARSEGTMEVDVGHLERVLPQLMLDF